MHRKILCLIGAISIGLSAFAATAASPASLDLIEPAAARHIPLIVLAPRDDRCASHCPVAIFGTGYRNTAAQYLAIATQLADAGYLSVIIQFDLPEDSPMPDTGNIAADRGFFWHRGTATLESVLARLPALFPACDWARLTLAGHSQGGDIAALYATDHPEHVEALITLDNRRVPLPDKAPFSILSLRSSDQPADAGVLPPESATTCIIKLDATRHNDMTDSGPEASRQVILTAISRFVINHQCSH